MALSTAQAHALGSYELIRKLGSGGMAEVFLAAQHMAGDVERPVVIKAMLPHLAEDQHFVNMFMREAKVAALLNHPNVVQIYDVSVIDGRPCIVMEFLRGRDLWHVLREMTRQRAPVPMEAAASIVAQAATGLDYAHRRRDDKGRRIDLVHRDISPHNLFLTREGHVRVLDFGIAKSRYQQQRTQSGVLKGKLPYMAPEQARGTDIDGRADMFALGVILWETLTASRLFAREDPFQTMNALFHLEVPPPSSYREEVPAELDRICLLALARDPTDRFESCDALAGALRDWMRSATTEREPALITSLLERAVPSQLDEAFYGFDLDSTSPSVVLPENRDDHGGPDGDTVLRPNLEMTPSQSGVGAIGSGVGRGPAQDSDSVADLPTSIADPSARGPDALTAIGAARLETAIRPVPRPPATRAPLLALGVVAVLVAVGVGTGLALWGDDPAAVPERPSRVPPVRQAPAVAQQPPLRIEIAFADVPPGVVIEVDGSALEGTTLSTVASDEVRHVRALRGDVEIWRYDGIFRESATVPLPPLQAPAAEKQRRPLQPPGSRMNMAGTGDRGSEQSGQQGTGRLGNDLDLGYP